MRLSSPSTATQVTSTITHSFTTSVRESPTHTRQSSNGSSRAATIVSVTISVLAVAISAMIFICLGLYVKRGWLTNKVRRFAERKLPRSSQGPVQSEKDFIHKDSACNLQSFDDTTEMLFSWNDANAIRFRRDGGVEYRPGVGMKKCLTAEKLPISELLGSSQQIERPEEDDNSYAYAIQPTVCSATTKNAAYNPLSFDDTTDIPSNWNDAYAASCREDCTGDVEGSIGVGIKKGLLTNKVPISAQSKQPGSAQHLVRPEEDFIHKDNSYAYATQPTICTATSQNAAYNLQSFDDSTDIPSTWNDAYATSSREDCGGGVEYDIKAGSEGQDVPMVKNIAYT